MGIWEWLFGEDENGKEKRKRAFISFAIEDKFYRDCLVGQARDKRSPFDFIDMSVKKSWPKSEWKRRCRTKIKGCDCMIVLLSKHTWSSKGSRWEIRCAIEEGVYVAGMHIKKNDKGAIPPELTGCLIIE